MDSSDITGSRELQECSENESGWTFYINSPTQEDDNYGGVYDCSSGDDDKDHNSDDSMASDAASGPSQLPSGTSDYFKNEDCGHQRKFSIGNKSQKQAKDRGERSTKDKREPKLKRADSSGSHVRNKASKGRKTN